MNTQRRWTLSTACFVLGLVTSQAAVSAETTSPPTETPPAGTADAGGKAPDALFVYFDLGSSAIRPDDVATLDQASRKYRDGKPIIMVVTGATDSVGSADGNLRLSQTRANAVLRELVARGIPVERFQIVSKGETDPAVATEKGTAERRNRRVEISWR